jgi:hypothetical protein
MLGPLLIFGAVIGVAIGALGHPKIYRGIFGGPPRSDDH